MKDAYHHERGQVVPQSWCQPGHWKWLAAQKLAQTYSTRIVVIQGSQYLSRGGGGGQGGCGRGDAVLPCLYQKPAAACHGELSHSLGRHHLIHLPCKGLYGDIMVVLSLCSRQLSSLCKSAAEQCCTSDHEGIGAGEEIQLPQVTQGWQTSAP